MADFEPVELDFMYGGNTQTEGPKIIKTTEQIAAAHAEATKMVERHTATVVELRKDLVELGTAYKKATTKEAKSEILTEIELTKKNIIDETAAIKTLKAEIASMGKMPKASVMPDANQVAKTAMGYNGLNMSMQQIVRELPAASMGLNMFFLAIGNNIPMATDAIKRARLENEALKASGASTVPVWKQLMSSIVSWQSLMMVGITVATMYGKEIFQAFNKGSEAAERAKESTKKYNDAFAQSVADPLVKVNQLSERWNKLGDNLEEKKKFVDANKDAFRDLGVEVENVKDAENLLVDNVDAFRQAMIAKAMSVAAMQIATEKYQEYFKKMREAEKMSDTVDVVTSSGGQSVTGGGTMQTTTVKNSTKEKTKAMADTIKKEGDALITESNKQNDLYEAFLEKAGIKRIEKEIKIRERAAIEAYNSEEDFQKLIYALTEKSESMLIGLKKDSLAKRLELIQQEKDKELSAIKEKELAIIEEYNKVEKKKADEYNKTHKKKIQPQLLSTAPGDISASLATINPEQAKQLANATQAVNDAFQAKVKSTTKDWNDDMLELANQYASKSEQIRFEYTQKIKDLEAKGLKDVAVVAATEMEKKISAEEQKLIEETDIYKLAIDEKLKLTKEMNDKLIQLVKDRINANKDLSQEDKDKLIAKVDQSDAGRASNPLDGLVKAYGNLKKAKEDAAAAEKIGDVEGAAKAAKAIEGLEGTVKNYGATVVGIFDQAANGIVGIMDHLGMFTEEEKDMATDVVNTVSSAGTLAVGIAKHDIGSIISGAIGTISGLLKIFDKKGRDIERKQKSIQKNIDELTAAYARLQRQVEKALGTDIYDAQKAQIENLKQQIEANEDWIEQEMRKKRKKRNKKEIAERKKEIEELYNQIDDTVNAITESLAQTNTKDLASELSDALVSAFQNGESAAVAMGGVVDNVLRNAVINALKLKVLDKLLAPAIDTFASDMESGGELTGSEADKFRNSITAAGEAYFKALNEANDALGGIFTGNSTATGIKGDAAKMTEETGSALVGQIIAMRLNVAAMLLNSKSSLDSIGKVLATLELIKTNTDKLIRIDETLCYIKNNGVKVV